ncbi:SDR family oxidoreductase [Candidatus Woesearchaeota archaeon]|nr:SDR family oxidoreductase [Candidatus Woesearchaeota archaeon]
MLSGKVVVITGGGSGFGKANANRAAHEGAQVIILERKPSATSKEIIRSGGKAVSIVCDVAKESAVKQAFSEIKKHFGKVDVLVNNAGIFRHGNIVSTTAKDWDEVLAVNLKGVYLCSKYAIPLTRKGGSIVNISSYYGLQGGASVAAYCASKGGVLNLTRAMALAHAREGIRVNCICPGAIDTPMLRKDFPTDRQVRAIVAANPMGRVGKPEEVAAAILWLASDEASYVTGAILSVDGGDAAGVIE